MNMPTADKPLPEPSPETQAFWDGLKAHKMVLQRCTDCKLIRHYPRPMCPSCFSFEADWVEASGNGKVYSWTVAHHPFHQGFKAQLPYVVLTVELEEGVRMVGPLSGGTEDDLKLGLPVRIEYVDVDDNVTLPRFTIDG